MWWSSSRDNWERLVAAVVKRQQIWELCHQPSRSPSIITTSDDDLSERTLSFSGHIGSFSVPASPLFSPKNPSNSPAEYPEIYLRQLERFSLHQLQAATDEFSNKNIIGRGRFGNLYKGRLVDGTLVAINRLKTIGGELRFHTEVEVFSIMPEHRNLLSLRGFCMTSKEWLLVYPYMVNGSVASCLRERPPDVAPLDWRARKHIALGCARGLSYLHDHCDLKIIHGNVKASNILLDEDYEAVIGDFSLAKLMDHNDNHETPGYLSTEKPSDKTDVYGYGFTLLELITGQKPFDLPRLAHDDNLMLLDWVKGLLKEKELATLVDPDLQNNYVDEEAEQLIQVALLCTQTSALGRPKMSEVVRLLDGDGLAEKWDEWHMAEHGLHPTSDRTVVDSTIGARRILEIREASPTHFLMRVESFSLLGKNGIHKYETREFNAGGHKWKLILYPNEDKIGIDSKYISVNLAISDTASQKPANWEVNAVFSIFLLNQISGNYHYTLGRTQRFQEMKSEWGISKFISKNIFMDPCNGFLIDNNCVFGAEVFIVEKLAVSECLFVKNVTAPHKHNWKISNFSKLGDCWTSDKFVVEGLNWEVSLHPKGDSHEKGRCHEIGIFLRLIDSKRVKACFSICIKDQIDDEHEKCTVESHWFSSPTSDNSWGWPQFMELATLEDPKNGFIINDCCLLELELSVQAVV